jgi:hypothetical protein
MLIDSARNAVGFFVSHPLFLAQSAKNALHRELTIPIALLQWAIDRRPRGKGPERIELYHADPALGLRLTVDLYGTKLDVSCELTIESIAPRRDALEIALRVRNLKLEAPQGSPAEMMVKSLDLSRPAALMAMMPQKHSALVEARDDRFVLDLLKIRALGNNVVLRRVLTALSFLTVAGARADGDALALRIDVSPMAAPGALRDAALRSPASA